MASNRISGTDWAGPPPEGWQDSPGCRHVAAQCSYGSLAQPGPNPHSRVIDKRVLIRFGCRDCPDTATVTMTVEDAAALRDALANVIDYARRQQASG